MSNKRKYGGMKKWLVFRGLQLILGFEPKFLVTEISKAVITNLIPILTVVFSSRVIMELSEQKRIPVLYGWVFSSVITLFLLFSIKAILYSKSDLMEKRFEMQFLTYLNARFSLLKYCDTEQTEIISLFRKVYANHSALGGGVFRLYQNIPRILGAIIGLLMSIAMFCGMFTGVPAVKGKENLILSQGGDFLLMTLIVVSVIVNAGVGIYFQKRIYKLMEDLPNSNHLVSYYEDYMTPGKAGKDIRIYNQKAYILDIFKNRFGGINLFKGESSASSWQNGISSISLSILNMMVYLLIGLRAFYGWYSIGSVVQYVGAINHMILTMVQLSGATTALWTNYIFLSDQYRFFDIPNGVEEREGNGVKEIVKEILDLEVISFHQVSFRYPESEKWALHGLSMNIHKGERIAVVGANGSGKTTMIKLLCRLYKPTEGYITINGININEFDEREYEKLISPVFQDFVLPSLPIGQVIACDIHYDSEKVFDCLKKAGLAERISRMKDGLETALNKDVYAQGVSLSGGEEQKLALARAIYREAPIMILDEPTAALDPISEHEVYSQFDKIVSNKTAVYVSHRLSSCQFCGRIFVFQQGELVEMGSHEELLSGEHKVYQALWNAQAQYYQENEL